MLMCLGGKLLRVLGFFVNVCVYDINELRWDVKREIFEIYLVCFINFYFILIEKIEYYFINGILF